MGSCAFPVHQAAALKHINTMSEDAHYEWRCSVRREGHHADADDAGEEEDVNIIAELRPFLPHEPPLIERNPFRADEAPVPDMQSTASALSGVPDAVAEAQAVKAYLAANGRASSLYAAGIALLSAMPQEHRQRWTKGTAEQALALASALGSAWRPEGIPVKSPVCAFTRLGPVRISQLQLAICGPHLMRLRADLVELCNFYCVLGASPHSAKAPTMRRLGHKLCAMLCRRACPHASRTGAGCCRGSGRGASSATTWAAKRCAPKDLGVYGLMAACLCMPGQQNNMQHVRYWYMLHAVADLQQRRPLGSASRGHSCLN